jgi:hypothetical protein
VRAWRNVVPSKSSAVAELWLMFSQCTSTQSRQPKLIDICIIRVQNHVHNERILYVVGFVKFL